MFKLSNSNITPHFETNHKTMNKFVWALTIAETISDEPAIRLTPRMALNVNH